jgi:hypothetical protein
MASHLHDDPNPATGSPRVQAGRRIETQIHRRKKAKAIPPLEAEWDEGSNRPPHLKMSSEHMTRDKEGRDHAP